eukprot:3546984-Rhodomonas_salina.2
MRCEIKDKTTLSRSKLCWACAFLRLFGARSAMAGADAGYAATSRGQQVRPISLRRCLSPLRESNCQPQLSSTVCTRIACDFAVCARPELTWRPPYAHGCYLLRARALCPAHTLVLMRSMHTASSVGSNSHAFARRDLVQSWYKLYWSTAAVSLISRRAPLAWCTVC